MRAMPVLASPLIAGQPPPRLLENAGECGTNPAFGIKHGDLVESPILGSIDRSCCFPFRVPVSIGVRDDVARRPQSEMHMA